MWEENTALLFFIRLGHKLALIWPISLWLGTHHSHLSVRALRLSCHGTKTLTRLLSLSSRFRLPCRPHSLTTHTTTHTMLSTTHTVAILTTPMVLHRTCRRFLTLTPMPMPSFPLQGSSTNVDDEAYPVPRCCWAARSNRTQDKWIMCFVICYAFL